MTNEAGATRWANGALELVVKVIRRFYWQIFNSKEDR